MLCILSVISEVSLQADHVLNVLFILIRGSHPGDHWPEIYKLITVINHVPYKLSRLCMHKFVDVTCVSWHPEILLLADPQVCVQYYLQCEVQHSHVQRHSHMTDRDSKCVLRDWDVSRYCLQTFLWREMQLHERQSELKHAKPKVVALWVFYMTRNNKVLHILQGTACFNGFRSLDNPHLWIWNFADMSRDFLSRSILHVLSNVKRQVSQDTTLIWCMLYPGDLKSI